ncbi:MAG: twin-arginine translocase TatA/TatE family subunit [Verrucomicrobiia bacterium]
MNAIFAVFGMGGGELILVLGAVLILFGAKKIPEFAKGLGQGMKEFKKASREVTEELENAMNTETPPPPPKRVASPSATEPVSTEAATPITPATEPRQ